MIKTVTVNQFELSIKAKCWTINHDKIFHFDWIQKFMSDILKFYFLIEISSFQASSIWNIKITAKAKTEASHDFTSMLCNTLG